MSPMTKVQRPGVFTTSHGTWGTACYPNAHLMCLCNLQGAVLRASTQKRRPPRQLLLPRRKGSTQQRSWPKPQLRQQPQQPRRPRRRLPQQRLPSQRWQQCRRAPAQLDKSSFPAFFRACFHSVNKEISADQALGHMFVENPAKQQGCATYACVSTPGVFAPSGHSCDKGREFPAC